MCLTDRACQTNKRRPSVRGRAGDVLVVGVGGDATGGNAGATSITWPLGPGDTGVFRVGMGARLTLLNLTVANSLRGGRSFSTTNSSDLPSMAGGVFVETGAMLYARGVRFEGCGAQLGGAVYVEFGGAALLDGVEFIENYAWLGGAVYLEQRTLLLVAHARLEANWARDHGGGLFLSGGTTHDFNYNTTFPILASVVWTLFSRNVAGIDGSALKASNDVEVSLEHSTLRDGIAGRMGAAVCVTGAGANFYAGSVNVREHGLVPRSDSDQYSMAAPPSVLHFSDANQVLLYDVNLTHAAPALGGVTAAFLEDVSVSAIFASRISVEWHEWEPVGPSDDAVIVYKSGCVGQRPAPQLYSTSIELNRWRIKADAPM